MGTRSLSVGLLVWPRIQLYSFLGFTDLKLCPDPTPPRQISTLLYSQKCYCNGILNLFSLPQHMRKSSTWISTHPRTESSWSMAGISTWTE
jgi:hypothetical protein